MLKIMFACGAALLAVVPATAATEDHARIAIGDGAMLKRAEAVCGPAGKLAKKDLLSVTYARAAAEQALPLSQFQPLLQTSEDAALTASQAANFCADTRKRRSSMVSRVRKAGQALVKAKQTG